MSGPAIIGLGGGQVLLRGPAVVDAWRLASSAATVTARRDGMAVPPRVAALLAVLEREAGAVMAAVGHADVPDEPPVPPSEQIPTWEAARMLSLSTRQTRRIATELGGRRLAGRWTFDRAAVAAARAERRAA